MITAPRWDGDRLESDRRVAIEQFRQERIAEPLAAYVTNFDRYSGAVENLLDATSDLAALAEQAARVLSDADLLYASRYIAGPPISEDDLRVLSNISLTRRTIQENPADARRVAETILLGLDPRRFPWLAEGRRPTDAERRAAVIASAALIATQRVRTSRAADSPARQQGLVRATLSGAGLVEDEAKAIPNLSAAPPVGHFCGESQLGTRKADVVVRLWDGRLLAIECKVSNSELNSIKRLTNDAAVKARVWLEDFGRTNIVPAAVVAGVFGLRHLTDSQERGLVLFWSHSLGEMTDFIEATREDPV